jgi:small subunit ribosomal protein S3
MGQKINPIVFRIGMNRTWDSRWFADTDYQSKLHEDLKIRKYLKKRLKEASVSKIAIERSGNKMRVTIYTSKPGIIIGKKGADIEEIRKSIAKFTKDEVSLNIVEVKKPEIDANIVAQGIAGQLERRVAFRKALKRAIQTAMRMGAEGIRVNVSGRLNGSEIARMEWYREGRVPLHTLRADVDYGTAEAHTTYGVIGLKVWVFKGEVLARDPMAFEKKLSAGKN